MNTRLSDRTARGLLLCTSALCMSLTVSGPTFAQSTSGADAPLEEVVVTGSRIVRRDQSSDSPLVTVTSQDLQATGSISMDQMLTRLPQFTPGSNQFTDSGSTQTSPTTSPGIASVNLRHLGTNRTLVLVDGRRYQPADASLVVDLNTIPSMAIDNVEVITGGAGSTYGADAVAGVVNFKLKRDFEGLSFDGQYGITQQGDGEEYKASTLFGTNFSDDRGNVMVGLSYAKRRPAYNKKHDFFSEVFTDPNTPGGGQPLFPAYPDGGASDAAQDAVFPGQPAGDVRSRVFYFQPGATVNDASIFVTTPGAVSGDPAVGYTGPLAPQYKLSSDGILQLNTVDGYLSMPLESYTSFLSAYYDITPNVEFYVQGSFDHKELTTKAGSYTIAFNQWSVKVPRDGAHPIPDSLATLLNSRTSTTDTLGNVVTGADAPWTLQNSLDNYGLPQQQLHNTTNTYHMVTGFRGDIGIKDWTYDVFGSHGATNQLASYDGYVDYEAYQTLIELPNYGAGTDFSNGRLGRNASCTSGLNPFTTAPVSQDCIDILNPYIQTTTDITQNVLEADIQGGLFEMPAGELRFAVGADYRSNSFKYQPAKPNSTSNITSFTVGLFDTTQTQGNVKVKEIYGEVLVPLLADLPMVQDLTLNAGYRYSDYNNIGGVSTWKATGDWTVNDFIRIRGGYQLANRAPNVAELYQPALFTIVDWPDADPCSKFTRAPYGNVESNPDRDKVIGLCNALAGNDVVDEDFQGSLPFYFPLGRDLQSGNPDLDSEKAHTWTLGTVINSPFESDALRALTLTLDYYHIKINDAIAPASSQVVYQECFNGFGNNPDYDPNFDYCQRILRNPTTGFWVATLAQYENLGMISTAGLDATINWGIDVPSVVEGPGRLSVNVLFNYMDSYNIQNSPGGPILDYSNTVGYFRWKLNTTVGYSFGPASVNINWRHLPSAHNVAYVTNHDAAQLDTKSFDVFDLNASWQINDTIAMRAGIENLFNRDPNRVGVLPGTTDAASTTTADYDQLGRRFYFGIGADF